MSKNKILFVDLLYSEYGAYDDDFNAIRDSLPEIDCEHLKCSEKEGFSGVLRVYRAILTFRYVRVVYLSAKVSQLALLAPLGLYYEKFVIYHFMPKSRRYFHSVILPILIRFFHFATYSEAVADSLQKIGVSRPLTLPSRIIEKGKSERLLQEKIAKTSELVVLIPGVRIGVRKFIDPSRLICKLRQATGIGKIRLIIQIEGIAQDDKNPNIQYISSKLSKKEYDELYEKCNVVAIDFDENYEVRASGVILDAAAAGCIIFTTSHNITHSYGFPDTILCDMNRIRPLIEQIRSGCSLKELIPGVGAKEFSTFWREFLKI